MTPLFEAARDLQTFLDQRRWRYCIIGGTPSPDCGFIAEQAQCAGKLDELAQAGASGSSERTATRPPEIRLCTDKSPARPPVLLF
jgi:hypothetical protein